MFFTSKEHTISFVAEVRRSLVHPPQIVWYIKSSVFLYFSAGLRHFGELDICTRFIVVLSLYVTEKNQGYLILLS